MRDLSLPALLSMNCTFQSHCNPSGFISPLAANTAPVMAPLPIEFHGSSLPRIPIRQQSNVENNPPHTAKLPAITIHKFIAMQKIFEFPLFSKS